MIKNEEFAPVKLDTYSRIRFRFAWKRDLFVETINVQESSFAVIRDLGQRKACKTSEDYEPYKNKLESVTHSITLGAVKT